MNIDLTDKTALVTGGSRGIGREICIRLAGAGAKVVINYNRSEAEAEEVRSEIEKTGARAEVFRADISDHEQVEKLFQFLGSRFGGVDILVNNAGIIRDNLLLSMRLSDWDRVCNTNLRGAFICTQKAVEMMMPNHSGKIINIASVSALRGGRGQTNYAAAKGGLISFTRAAAVELSGKGIQVNAVLPGFIVTEMTRRVRKRAGDRILESIPAGRFGETGDVAGLVAFLASNLSDYITGQVIAVDGGLSIA